MNGPFTTITVNQYYRLQDVLRAADRVLECMSEFPKEPAAWAEWVEVLARAVREAKQ